MGLGRPPDRGVRGVRWHPRHTLRDTGIPIIVVTMRIAKTGKVRKIGLMRVEHDGSYALVASKGGDPAHPAWYHNITADPHVLIQDGPEPHAYVVRAVHGHERETWWQRAAEGDEDD